MLMKKKWWFKLFLREKTNKLIQKIDSETKIADIENKMPSTTSLLKNGYDTKVKQT